MSNIYKPQTILKDPSVKYQQAYNKDKSSGDIFLKQNSIFSSGYSTANLSQEKKNNNMLKANTRENFDAMDNFITHSSI
jgi:hypothetical protein